MARKRVSVCRSSRQRGIGESGCKGVNCPGNTDAIQGRFFAWCKRGWLVGRQCFCLHIKGVECIGTGRTDWHADMQKVWHMTSLRRVSNLEPFCLPVIDVPFSSTSMKGGYKHCCSVGRGCNVMPSACEDFHTPSLLLSLYLFLLLTHTLSPLLTLSLSLCVSSTWQVWYNK